MNRAIIDIETSGFSITKNAVCEIGLLIIDSDYNVLEQKSWIIKPYTRPDGIELVSYKEDAMLIHGISMDDIERGYNVEMACVGLLFELDSYDIKTLIGHNFRLFDNPRLKYLVERFTDFNFNYEILDTLEEAKKVLKLDSYSLESLCKHFNTENNNSHRALYDCVATLDLLKKLES